MSEVKHFDIDGTIVDIPVGTTVNNGTLTIQKNGTNVQTFSANQSNNATANITVPTKVSELTNDSGYTTNTGTVTQVKVGSTAYNPSSGVVSLPAYPTVNNATLTIQKNGTNVATFTANQSSNATANITVPTVNNGTLTIQKNGTNVATFTANQSGNATANITVPTVNNGTLTIQKNGTNVATFTANQSGNATANITVPTTLTASTNYTAKTVNVPAQAWTNIQSISVPANKVAIITASVKHSSSTAVCEIALSEANNSDGYVSQSVNGKVGYDANRGNITMIAPAKTNAHNIYLNCWCESALSVTMTSLSACYL
jgi:hypothetical protein